MRNAPNRIKFQPIKYSGRESVAKQINENFSEILVDGVPSTHLLICKCKRLMARQYEFETNTKRHLRSAVHSKGCRTLRIEAEGDAQIDEPHMKILKVESGPMPQSPTPLVISKFEPKEQVPPPPKLVSTSTHSIHLSQDFLDRKYKLEALLWIEPRLFVFMPAQSIQVPLYKPTAIFRELAIPGFRTDDLIVCTSCVSILNNSPNDIWNVETHRATRLHFENVKSLRGIQVKNFDFNILKRHFH